MHRQLKEGSSLTPAVIIELSVQDMSTCRIQELSHPCKGCMHPMCRTEGINMSLLKTCALLHQMLHNQLSCAWRHSKPCTLMPSCQKQPWNLGNWAYERQPTKGIGPQPHPHPATGTAIIAKAWQEVCSPLHDTLLNAM